MPPSPAPVVETQSLWRRRGVRKYPGTIQVVIGPPIDTRGRSAADINAEVRDWIEARMAEISATSR